MRKLLRTAKRIANKLFGTKSDLIFWRFRHFFDRKWSESYISEASFGHPHRQLLVEKIISYKPKNVLEVGCASGPNLVLLSKKIPDAKLEGIDVSPKAIETGRKYLESRNIENVELKIGDALNLEIFSDKTFDVVFTDAALIYVDKSKIEGVLKELTRIAKKAVVLNEWHTNEKDSLYRDHWIHNYKDLFEKLSPNAQVKSTKISEEVWPGDWSKYGYIVEFVS